jgi:hypothetical protein
MRTKRIITEVTAKRCRTADRKGKTRIPDEFVKTTGYNRKYALHILANRGKTALVRLDGEAVKLRAGNERGPKKRRPGSGRPKTYTEDVVAALRVIWAVYGWMCGKRLVPFIRASIGWLAADPAFRIETEEVRAKLVRISPSSVDRLLRKDRAALRVKGKSLTRPGALLKSRIPVRTFFHWDERKPGFFEIDTVSHCGANSSGEFCSTLTVTDVSSGWTEVRALRNRAHRKKTSPKSKPRCPSPCWESTATMGASSSTTSL